MSFRYTVSIPQWIQGKDAEGEAIVVSENGSKLH
jgi:hypothetical protein